MLSPRQEGSPYSHSHLPALKMHHYLQYPVFRRLQTQALADAISRFVRQNDILMHYFQGTNGKPRLRAGAWGLGYRLRGLRKSKTGECGHHSSTRHFIRRLSVNARRSDALVSQRLLDDCQIDVCAYQREAQRVFQAMRMPLVGWQPCALCRVGENAIKLAPVNAAGLLGDENVFAGMIAALSQPRLQHALLA